MPRIKARNSFRKSAWSATKKGVGTAADIGAGIGGGLFEAAMRLMFPWGIGAAVILTIVTSIADGSKEDMMAKDLKDLAGTGDFSELQEGQCYYTSPTQEFKIVFNRPAASLTENMWRALSPFHTAIEGENIEIGRLPLHEKGQCNLLDASKYEVFTTAEAAAKSEAALRLEYAKKVQDLVITHGKDNLLLTIKVDKEIPAPVAPAPVTPQ